MSGPVEQLVTRMTDLNERFGEKLGGVTRADGSALHVPEKMRQAGRSWTPEQIFGLALQMGNQSNMDRLHAGFPDLDMESVAVLLGDDAAYHLFGADAAPMNRPRPGLLTAADWKAVQGIWDAVNSLWPDTVGTHRKLYGFAPKKVEGVPMTLRVGDTMVELSGGYFPAKYDPRLSETAAARQEREDILRSGQALLRLRLRNAVTLWHARLMLPVKPCVWISDKSCSTLKTPQVLLPLAPRYAMWTG